MKLRNIASLRFCVGSSTTHFSIFKSCCPVSQAGRTIIAPSTQQSRGEKVSSSQRITGCDAGCGGADTKRVQIGKSYPSIGSPTRPQKGRIGSEMNALFRVSRPTIFLRTSQGRRSCLPKAHNSRRQPDQQKSPDSSQTDNPQDETFCLQSFFTFHDIGWCGQSESCLRNVFGGKVADGRCWNWKKKKRKRCKLFRQTTNKVDKQAANFINIYFHRVRLWPGL